MTRTQCLSEDTLARFVDADLPPESAGRVSEHLSACGNCSEQVRDLRLLVQDIGTVHVGDLDVAAHVQEVLRRMDHPPTRDKRPGAMAKITAIAAIAASLVLVTHAVGTRHGAPSGTWQARGSSKGESISRDVGAQVYKLDKSLQPLHSGDIIAPDTALTAGLRNLSHSIAYVLIFAIDSRNSVHWITPQFTRAGENPASTELTSAPEERVLPTSVVFDDLAWGPMRIVTIVSPVPVRVSQVENLAESELVSKSLVHHFAGAEVREIAVQVTGAKPGKTP